MSYSEENGQAVLRMSREDYDRLEELLRRAERAEQSEENDQLMAYMLAKATYDRKLAIQNFMNRLNSGNPNYTPYQVGGETWRVSRSVK